MNSFFDRIALFKRRSYDYLDMLGLNHANDGLGTKDKYFFSYPLIQERLISLHHMMKGKNLLTLVIGGRGSGKTTLLNQFLLKFKFDWCVKRIWLPVKDAKQFQAEKELSVIECRGADLPCFIVDDAHRLDTPAMEGVLRCAWSDTRKRLLQHIVLFSEPEMHASLADLYNLLPPKSVINKLFLPRLSRQQTVSYLNHRLKTARCIKKIPFDSKQLDRIHKTAKGLPGWINGEAYMMLRRMDGDPMSLRTKSKPIYHLSQRSSLAFRSLFLKTFST
jgi:type II secretory pathway predicted ATPase ExeA